MWKRERAQDTEMEAEVGEADAAQIRGGGGGGQGSREGGSDKCKGRGGVGLESRGGGGGRGLGDWRKGKGCESRRRWIKRRNFSNCGSPGLFNMLEFFGILSPSQGIKGI